MQRNRKLGSIGGGHDDLEDACQAHGLIMLSLSLAASRSQGVRGWNNGAKTGNDHNSWFH